jgi:host factor-I protein
MPKTTLNIQDSFLNQARRDRTSVTVHLLDGAEIEGKITAFDNFTVIVTNDDSQQQYLLYKHAIASIAPKGKVRWSNSSREEGSERERR